MADYGAEEVDFDENENQGEEADVVEDEGEGAEREGDSRVNDIEEELDQLTSMQNEVDQHMSTPSDGIDENSVYIGEVDYEATQEELRAHFAPCGTINRVTIICDKFTGNPKGYAASPYATSPFALIPILTYALPACPAA